MKKPCLLFVIVFLAILTISCASPIKEKLFSRANPQFDGIVTPITIPIQFEYKPASGNFKLDTIVGAIVGNKKYSDESSFSGNFQVSRLGDSLIWNSKITRMKTGNNSFAPTLPILDARLLTNKFGKIEESEISFPAFEKANIEENQRKKIYDDTKNALKNFGQSLPQTPIKSGDVLAVLMDKDQIEAMVQHLWTSAPALSFDSAEHHDINLILKGWSYYQNRKVLVGLVHDSLLINAQPILSVQKSELNFHIKIIGYSLLDWETLHSVNDELLIDIDIFEASTGTSGILKGLTTYSFELKN